MMYEDFTTTMVNKCGITNESMLTGGLSVARLGDNILIHGHTVTGRRVILLQDSKGSAGGMPMCWWLAKYGRIVGSQLGSRLWFSSGSRRLVEWE